MTKNQLSLDIWLCDDVYMLWLRASLAKCTLVVLFFVAGSRPCEQGRQRTCSANSLMEPAAFFRTPPLNLPSFVQAIEAKEGVEIQPEAFEEAGA